MKSMRITYTTAKLLFLGMLGIVGSQLALVMNRNISMITIVYKYLSRIYFGNMWCINKSPHYYLRSKSSLLKSSIEI